MGNHSAAGATVRWQDDDRLTEWTIKTCNWLLEIVKRPRLPCFVLLKRRWVVERTHFKVAQSTSLFPLLQGATAMNQEEDEDDCRAVEIPEPHFSNEGERLRYVEEMENNESRREILLGQIAVARGRPYEAEESGDKSKAAGLEKLIADLIVFSFGFEAFT